MDLKKEISESNGELNDESVRDTVGIASSLSPMDNSATTSNGAMYEFEIPNSLVGLVIGVKGKLVKELGRRTGAFMRIVKHHETAKVDSHQICQVSGTDEQVNNCLEMLRKRFPPKKFPELNLQPLLPPSLPTNFADVDLKTEISESNGELNDESDHGTGRIASSLSPMDNSATITPNGLTPSPLRRAMDAAVHTAVAAAAAAVVAVVAVVEELLPRGASRRRGTPHTPSDSTPAPPTTANAADAAAAAGQTTPSHREKEREDPGKKRRHEDGGEKGEKAPEKKKTRKEDNPDKTAQLAEIEEKLKR